MGPGLVDEILQYTWTSASPPRASAVRMINASPEELAMVSFLLATHEIEAYLKRERLASSRRSRIPPRGRRTWRRFPAPFRTLVSSCFIARRRKWDA